MDELSHPNENVSAHLDNRISQAPRSSVFDSDSSLLTRVRALLLSRNSHYPPKTPCPSPEFTSNRDSTNVSPYTPNLRPIIRRNKPGLDDSSHLRKSAVLRRASSTMVFDRFENPDGSVQGIRASNIENSLHWPSKDMQALDADIFTAMLQLEQGLRDSSIGSVKGSVKNSNQRLPRVHGDKQEPSRSSYYKLRTIAPRTPQIVPTAEGTPRSVSPVLGSFSKRQTIEPVVFPGQYQNVPNNATTFPSFNPGSFEDPSIVDGISPKPVSPLLIRKGTEHTASSRYEPDTPLISSQEHNDSTLFGYPTIPSITSRPPLYTEHNALSNGSDVLPKPIETYSERSSSFASASESFHLIDLSPQPSIRRKVKGQRNNKPAKPGLNDGTESSDHVKNSKAPSRSVSVKATGQQRTSSLPQNMGSTVKRDIIELLQKANRARTMLVNPYDARNEGPNQSPKTSWDLQSAQAWISQFLKKSFSREDLGNEKNLTARPIRSRRSYIERDPTERDTISPQSIDGSNSQISASDVDQLNQRVIESLKNDSLDNVIKELESVLEDALVLARSAAGADDVELHRELQAIADSLHPNSNVDQSKRREDDGVKSLENESPQESQSPPRMRRISLEQPEEDEKELHKRIGEYHKTLQRMNDGKDSLRRSRASTTEPLERDSTGLTRAPSGIQRQKTAYDAISKQLQVNSSPLPSTLEVSPENKTNPNGPNIAQEREAEIQALRRRTKTAEARRSKLRSEITVMDWKPPEEWKEPPALLPVHTFDWATESQPRGEEDREVPSRATSTPLQPPSLLSREHEMARQGDDAQYDSFTRERRPTLEEVRSHIKNFSEPPVQPRSSSTRHNSTTGDSSDYVADFGSPRRAGTLQVNDKKPTFTSATAYKDFTPFPMPQKHMETTEAEEMEMGDISPDKGPKDIRLAEGDLTKHRHFSFRGRDKKITLHKSHKRAPIARDWSTFRKRFVAAIACVSTALIGLIIGIYAGEVPAIQYALVDEHHKFTYLGNVFLFAGLAISNFLFWPLPLIHGRKPYTLAALVILLPMLFPQALAVQQQRSPWELGYRISLLLPRFIAGLALGFANMNFFGILLDVFGSSLMSGNPHQEIVNPYDARRHGGGMGVWLSIWTWCSIGSIGVGFFVGAMIIEYLEVAWGFWISIIATVVVILLNVIAPETRRSAYRRSMAEVRQGTDISRRIARGEIMMHLYSTGPKYWWQEMVAGWVLCMRMLPQFGFFIVMLYQAWIYGQVVMVMILLGALTSRYYHLKPHAVALCVAAFPLGALLAIPFQKASLFSRARHRPPRTDSMTFERKVVWTSHMARRTIFMATLPLLGIAYTLSSGGINTKLVLPVLFSALIGALSNLALSECAGMVMENYDTSDLQPGMTGRPRMAVSQVDQLRRTNFSCFPRVTAAFALTQTLSFIIAAAATACGGNVERRLGAQQATAVVAGVLLVLTLLLFLALVRFKQVQIVPSKRVATAILTGPGENLPVVIGNPSGTMRRICLLELGNLTRWSEIRKKNNLL